MRVGAFHLTYCTNIHAGEQWPDVARALADVVPRVRAGVGEPAQFGLGLRLSADAAHALATGSALADFAAFLRRERAYVFTINGFPYGAFHGQRVKEQVYLPDWRDPRRLEYTDRLAEILAALLPDDVNEGSVSTVPGGFKAHCRTAGDRESIAANLRAHARRLRDLRDRTGRTIRLALEPEPACLFETVEETRTFFDRYLDDATTREFIGVCIDTCHMAVEFERPGDILPAFIEAGIRVPKVQVSSALDVRMPDGHEALRAFAEDTYLHQVVSRGDGLQRYVDLPDALSDDASRREAEWRVHFHVPLFLEELGPLRTTQPFVRAFLAELQRHPVCDHLEVETYTWDVLPAEHRRVDVATAIARELTWVRDQLA